jgi:hypothetical protein
MNHGDTAAGRIHRDMFYKNKIISANEINILLCVTP